MSVWLNVVLMLLRFGRLSWCVVCLIYVCGRYSILYVKLLVLGVWLLCIVFGLIRIVWFGMLVCSEWWYWKCCMFCLVKFISMLLWLCVLYVWLVKCVCRFLMLVFVLWCVMS